MALRTHLLQRVRAAGNASSSAAAAAFSSTSAHTCYSHMCACELVYTIVHGAFTLMHSMMIDWTRSCVCVAAAGARVFPSFTTYGSDSAFQVRLSLYVYILRT